MSTWHVLDVGSIWLKEFASALSKIEPVTAWAPDMKRFGFFQSYARPVSLDNPPMEFFRFPLQRGYARPLFRSLFPFQRRMIKRLLAHTSQPEKSPLICTTPFYAPVAELWPGPVIYYVTDLTIAYPSLDAVQVKAFDKRMCRVARAVCPNSKRITDYLTSQAQCDSEKITIIPNATRQSNVAAHPQYEPGALPEDIKDLPRPIAGVLGDLSGNMDWLLMAEVVETTPKLSWLFVGPANRPIANEDQRAARTWVQRHARFIGMKPYSELQNYARCLDVAVLPYRKHEPTYSGSSTRFYEHLAAGRPMVATRGFAELLEKIPLLKLVDTAEEMKSALNEIQSKGFQDGQEIARWEASKIGTWEQRARTMQEIALQF